MKTEKEYFMQLVESETPVFVRVLEALPADKLDWKPDPKAASAMERAAQIAMEAGQIVNVLTKGVLEFDPATMPKYASTAEMVAALKDGMAKSKAAAAALSDADWESEAKMMMGGKAVWTATRGAMALSFMTDLIHHRGQLSVYIRPMGGKVPSIYGPSADSAEIV